MITEFNFCLSIAIASRIYSCLSGVKDGRGHEAMEWKTNEIFISERIVFWMILMAGYYTHGFGPEPIFMLFVTCSMGITFWHNGCYYMVKGVIQNTNYPFWYNNRNKNTNSLETSWKLRYWMEILSWVLFMLYFYYIWFC